MSLTFGRQSLGIPGEGWLDESVNSGSGRDSAFDTEFYIAWVDLGLMKCPRMTLNSVG